MKEILKDLFKKNKKARIRKGGFFLFFSFLGLFGFVNYVNAGTSIMVYNSSLSSFNVSSVAGNTDFLASMPLFSPSDSTKYSQVSCTFSDFTISGVSFSSLRLYYYKPNGDLNFTSCTNLSNGVATCSTTVQNRGIAGCFIRANFNGVNTLTLSGTITFNGDNIAGSSDCPTCPTCEAQYTSSQCQSVYSLIPIDSVDSIYCQNNNLCPICEICNYSGYENSLNVCTNNLNTCQSNLSSCLAGNYTGLNWSSLYINDIQHLGGPSIYIDIPEEISRDYQYSSNDNMYIDIEGYNVNYDSISGAIAIQNYKPDSSDLNKIITDIIPLFVPGLVIVLFLYFVFRFIKKLF